MTGDVVLMVGIFNNIEEKKVDFFLRSPRLLQYFDAYILTKYYVVEKLAIEKGDENSGAVFFVLLVDAFVREKSGCGDVVSNLVLEHSGIGDRGFFAGKEKYLSEGLLKMIAEEFFLPCKNRFVHEKVPSFAELFAFTWSHGSKISDAESKEVVVEFCLKVLMRLASYQEPHSVKDVYLIENTFQHLSEIYDAIKEGDVSLREFYFFFEHGTTGTLQMVALSSSTKAYLKNIPGFASVAYVVRRIVRWFGCIG